MSTMMDVVLTDNSIEFAAEGLEKLLQKVYELAYEAGAKNEVRDLEAGKNMTRIIWDIAAKKLVDEALAKKS